MGEIEDDPSEIHSCFRVIEPLKISIDDLNRKRKLQAEPFDLPPKHKCRGQSFTTGPVSIFGQNPEANAIFTITDKGKREAVAQEDGPKPQSAKDSNIMADDSDSAVSAYFGGKVEGEHAITCSYDRPSTSSSSWGSDSDSFNYSSDSSRMLNKLANEEKWGGASAEHHPCHEVSEILEEQLLEFENIEQCTNEELEHILSHNSNGPNPNMHVLYGGERIGQGPQNGARKPTIDQEFEQYFSMLMM